MTKFIMLLALAAAAPAFAQPALPDRPITRAEVAAAVKAKFAQLDSNRDGVVSEREYAAYRERKAAGDLPEDVGAAAFVHIGGHWFERSDADGNGRVTLAEATARPMEAFDTADADGNGVVSVRERKLAMMLMNLRQASIARRGPETAPARLACRARR